MKALLRHFRSPVLASAAALAFASASIAGEPVLVAQADCYAVGQRVAAERGGTLARASEANQGGRSVCVVVVLVPGKDGERPRRTEVVVPRN
jgi:hypothetical protein